MGERTNISWCDHTFNGWIGCEKVSPGCKNCYAAVDTYARVSASRGLPLWGPGSSRHVTSEANWRKPLAWSRAAEREGVRRRVFCSSLSDVFEDRPDLVQPRARLIGLIRETPALDWLLLTKRPENAARLWADAWAHYGDDAKWLPNVWLGTTCEDQRRADERIPHLLDVPAAVRFVSYEPALGPVDFAAIRFAGLPAILNLDWIIVGGESGPGARPFDLAWARSVVQQCKAADVSCFVKQLGAEPRRRCDIGSGCAACLNIGGAIGPHGVQLQDRKGGNWDEWPEDLRVRQWPEDVTR